MPTTTIHLSAPLLQQVDDRARAQGLSRNRFIVRALQQVLEEDQSWSPQFLTELRKPLSPSDAAALTATLEEVARGRTSKPAPSL